VPQDPVRTFLDSGALICAFNGEAPLKEPALQVLEDPNRLFLSSPFVKHEVSPKALFNRRRGEYRFYEKYFRRAVMFTDLDSILRLASTVTSKFRGFAEPASHGKRDRGGIPQSRKTSWSRH